MVEEESCSCEVVVAEIALAQPVSLQALGRKESQLHLLEAPFGAVFSRETASAHPKLRRGLSQGEKLVALLSSQSPLVVVRDSRLRSS